MTDHEAMDIVNRDKLTILKSTKLFGQLTEEDYLKLAALTNPAIFSKGEYVFSENDEADAFYIIVEGNASIVKETKGGESSILAVKTKGGVFGEMAVIDELPRSAGVRAEEQLVLLKILKGDFMTLVESRPNIAIELSRGVCSTVRNSNISYINNLERRNRQLESAYRKLKEMQDELIQKEKLSLVGKFASLIVHDIKNPMTNIRAYAELIKITAKDNPKIDRSTGIIINEIDRLVKMTTELLEFSRGEMHLVKTPVNLSSLVSNAVDTLKINHFPDNIIIQFDEKCDGVIMGDPDKLTRMMFNLINNSVEAISTNSNGRIILKVTEEKDMVRFFIQDNGCGMEPEVLEKVFEPFYSYNKKKGTGLGMAIVKSIVESHNGKIKKASKPGIGTKFEIFFPQC